MHIYAKLSVVVGFGSSSSINGSDKMLGYELLPLSRVRSIEDGAFIFCHFVCVEETSRDLFHLVIITLQMNDQD